MLNFPPNPQVDDTYLRWRWDGEKWVCIGGPSGGGAVDEGNGTWTPVDATGAGIAIQNNGCRWHRVGKLMKIIFDFTYPANSDTGQATTGGLPGSDPSYSDWQVLTASMLYGAGGSSWFTALVNNGPSPGLRYTSTLGSPNPVVRTNAQLTHVRAVGTLIYAVP